MHTELVKLVERKLQATLHDIDARALGRAREAWKGIGPTTNCPAVGDVMKAIHTAITDGHKERSKACFEVVIETVSPFKSNLTKKLADKIMEVIQKLSPEQSFLPMARQTEGVYVRAQAPANKFSKTVFENELALIAVTEANLARQGVFRVRTGLDELLLQEDSRRPRWWKRLLFGFLKFLALPFAKWVLTLIGAVITGFVLHSFGLGGA